MLFDTVTIIIVNFLVLYYFTLLRVLFKKMEQKLLKIY